MKTHLKLVAPTSEKQTVMARRKVNAAYRTREHMTPQEVKKLIEAARDNRHSQRDGLMIMLCYQHGLRASELLKLDWSQVDFKNACLHVRRAKGGEASTHPMTGEAIRGLRALAKDRANGFVFVSERGDPFTVDGFNKLVKRAGVKAGLPFQCHSHMIRHSTGYKLANDGRDMRGIQSYLGHRSITSTARYTALAPNKFRGWWD
jgi:integrase